MDILREVLLLLAASVLVVSVFRRLALPPIIGYLFVGMLLGPGVTGLVGDTEDVRLLAEFGIVFLLFTIGLEFSFPQLLAMRWTVMGIGGAQVFLCSLVMGVLAWFAGASVGGAVVIGGALALSSTAIVTKQLTEQMEIHTRHGRRAVGVLLLQDLAVVPLLIVIPLLGAASEEVMARELGLAIAKGVVVFIVVVWLGRKVLRPLFHEIAAARSGELFTLAVLLVALLAAWATHLAGLSLALGAFLAGILLGETEYRHQIEADIRPFRDILLGLFFITVGMLVDPIGVLADWYWVLVIAAGMMLVKGALVYALVRFAGDESHVAMRAALILAQGGEFGFALLALALNGSLISPEASQIALSAIVLSMIAAPFLIRDSARVAHRLGATDNPAFGKRAENAIASEAAPLDHHVLICGFGRTGQNVARFLDAENIPFLALDLDPARVREAREAGERVNFGDSSRHEILQAAGLARARMLLVTYSDPMATLRVLEHAKRLAPDVPVVVRTRDDVWMERFEEEGATVVVPEVLEASLMLASHALALLELPLSRVFRYVRDVRADRYRLLRGYFHGEERIDPDKSERFQEQLRAVTLPESAHAVGRRLGDIGLDTLEVSVSSIRRHHIRGPLPEPEVTLQGGDVLVLYGTPEHLEHAEALLLGGEH